MEQQEKSLEDMTRAIEQKDSLIKKEFEEKQKLEAQINEMDLNVQTLN